MATRTLTSTSSNSDVIQELHWDTLTKKIEVVHMMNLDAGINVRWVSINQYAPGNIGYDAKCLFYKLDKADKIHISEFVYQEYLDGSFTRPHAVKFPEAGEYYPLSELDHFVNIDLKKEAIGETSTTSGQALSV